ncbi:diguanylate cyclase [Granulicella aggregans]|uniref:diguanylate cyclase n=1 Tax=Granulicella aggregans TaxID=474949 RepID=A0A7W8E3T8_9BACT|nr:diguanylate cyclase [Granulicella aggregans]MBB5057932.1 diguanylate cyclase [Granulicella aggregans]
MLSGLSARGKAITDTIVESLNAYDIVGTPENYALWWEYHSGTNPPLARTMNALISNQATFDDATLRDLYVSFLSSSKEEEAIREASSRVLETLQDVIALADGGRADARQFGSTLATFASGALCDEMATLRRSVEHLVQESKKMAGRTEYLGARMRESSTKIQTLERNLEYALKDATLDSLTGVANRKSFDQTIRRLAGDAMNSGEDLGLLMVDIDHFKKVNDTWGHQVGDQVLRQVAKTLELAVRGQDYVARYGGEEFAVLLPRADNQASYIVAQNIQRALLRQAGSFGTDQPVKEITLSIGVSCYEPGDALSEWIGRGDAALYRAKAAGRNRIEVI